MNKQDILKDYKKQEDKMCLSQVLDKIENATKKGKIEYTDFLDMYQVSLVESFLKKIKFENYILFGGYENAERKILIVYDDKYDETMIAKNYDKMVKVVKIELPEEEHGKYVHRNYLGGIVKLGLKREKVGDIIVSKDGADIIAINEFSTILKEQLPTLKRFENSDIKIANLEELRKVEIKIEEVKIIVPSLRLDNIVSDLARTSRSKASEIIAQERVFINGQSETKNSKNVKLYNNNKRKRQIHNKRIHWNNKKWKDSNFDRKICMNLILVKNDIIL